LARGQRLLCHKVDDENGGDSANIAGVDHTSALIASRTCASMSDSARATLHSTGMRTTPALKSIDWRIDSGASQQYCRHRDWFDTDIIAPFFSCHRLTVPPASSSFLLSMHPRHTSSSSHVLFSSSSSRHFLTFPLPPPPTHRLPTGIMAAANDGAPINDQEWWRDTLQHAIVMQRVWLQLHARPDMDAESRLKQFTKPRKK
jgi:hypothetical protein